MFFIHLIFFSCTVIILLLMSSCLLCTSTSTFTCLIFAIFNLSQYPFPILRGSYYVSSSSCLSILLITSTFYFYFCFVHICDLFSLLMSFFTPFFVLPWSFFLLLLYPFSYGHFCLAYAPLPLGSSIPRVSPFPITRAAQVRVVSWTHKA